MKYVIIIFCLVFSFRASAQITLDSFKVYQTGLTLDSVYMRATSYDGQILNGVYATPFNDACGTVFGGYYFTGCNGTQPITQDTMVVLNYFASQKMVMILVWDTSSNCVQPANQITMDTLHWNNCGPNAVEDIGLSNTISVYPNPIGNFINIKSESNISLPVILKLYNTNGQVLMHKPNYTLRKSQTEEIDVSNLSKGLYFLEIIVDKGKKYYFKFLKE